MNDIRLMLCCVCVVLLAACGGGGGSSAPPSMVTVTPPMASAMVGQQIQLAATIIGGTGSVTWSSSNAAVATVNSTGLVMALSLGQVTITAISGGGSGTAALTTTTGLSFAMVSAGSNHTCGVTLSGVAYCWGDNSSGQFGNGTTTHSAVPVLVMGNPRYRRFERGDSFHLRRQFPDSILDLTILLGE
jgi:Bacterial Ig-like domain (group 2)/Regulator of chromosome condensation (RCC1) repeat